MDDSPFNKLAAELRIKVYEDVFTRDEPIRLHQTRRYNDKRSPITLVASEGTKQFLALASTCRQIRDEALPVLLSRNTFTISWPDKSKLNKHSGYGLIKLWKILNAASPGSATCLKKLELDLGIWPQSKREISRLSCVVDGLMHAAIKQKLDSAFTLGFYLHTFRLYGFLNPRRRSVVMSMMMPVHATAGGLLKRLDDKLKCTVDEVAPMENHQSLNQMSYWLGVHPWAVRRLIERHWK